MRTPGFLQEGRWGRKVAVTAVVVVAIGAYLDHQTDQKVEQLRAESEQSDLERQQQRVDFDQSAACTADAINRGEAIATAVNGCVTGDQVSNAVFLSDCLETTLPEAYGRLTLADIDYYWTDCIINVQQESEVLDY